MTQGVASFPLGGGLDLVTPALAIKPGRAVAALNYEPTLSGYRRVQGYERFDGQRAPSSASIVRLPIKGQAIESLYDFQPGDLIYQQVPYTAPSAVGYILAITNTTGLTLVGTDSGGGAGLNGGVGGGDGGLEIEVTDQLPTADFLVLVTEGAFAVGEIIGPLSNVDQVLAADLNPDLTGLDSGTMLARGQDILRAAILPVPGSGPVRGLWFFEGNAYAVRDNEAGTAGVGWRSSLSQPTTSGTTRLLIGGNHITVGGAYIRLYGQYEGWMSIYDAFPPGGRYQFLTHNFYGEPGMAALYGVNGVGKGFTYDGTTFALLTTGVTVDTPTRVGVHKNTLFLGYPGGSIQFSEPGEPTSYDPMLGAGEIATGDEITDFLSVQSALAVFGEGSVRVLSGYDKDDFVLDTLTLEAGALPWTAARIGQAVYLDNRGLRSLNATSAYGNFNTGNLSMAVEPLLADLRRDGVQPTASFVCRTRSQYWLCFDNGVALVFLFGRKEVECLPVVLGFVATCTASVEYEGEERIFLGADNGYVYEFNKGFSFDGEPVNYYVRLAFNHFGSPQQDKRIHKVTVDMEASGAVTLSASVDINYGAQPGTQPQPLVLTAGGGAIDGLGSNELYFASQIETIAEAYVAGVGKNFSLKLAGSSATEDTHTLNAATYHISPRGLRR